MGKVKNGIYCYPITDALTKVFRKYLSSGQHDTGHSYTMETRHDTLAIEKVANKCLGIIIDSKLTFRDRIASKIKLANRNLGNIFR